MGIYRSCTAVAAASILLAGCSASPKTFYETPAKVKDTQLCRTFFEATTQNAQYAQDLATEAQRRGLTVDECQKRVATENGAIAFTALVATAVGVGLACKDGCSAPSYTPVRSTAGDFDCAGGPGDGPYFVQGPVRVSWDDPYDLDRDNDGIGCELNGDYGA